MNNPSLNNSNTLLDDNDNKEGYVSLDNRDIRQERDIDDFLNDNAIKRSFVKESDLESDSSTLNGDVQSVSVTSLPIMADCNNDVEKNLCQVSVNIATESEPIFGAQTSVIDSPLLIEEGEETMTCFNGIMASVNDTEPTTMCFADETDIRMGVLTVPSKQIIYNNIHQDSTQKITDNQILSNQLSELSLTVQRKDEEIKRLSQRLLELESNQARSKSECVKKYSRSSSLSSSSTESMTNSDRVEENKLNQDDEVCTTRIQENWETTTYYEKETFDSNIERVEEIKDCNMLDTKEILTNTDMSITSHNEEVIPNLRQKLNDLEVEVKRLHRANIDSLLCLESIQNNAPIYDGASNDSIIRQLMADHNALKEELDQLKLQHNKLTQPQLLSEEIQQLKVELNSLRNQNELLQKYVKSSSTKSLNATSKYADFRSSHETINDQFKESTELSKPSAYQSKPQPSPNSGNDIYRVRKLSDSSSALVEDTTPKMWLEPVIVTTKPLYQHRDPREFDQCSVDSFISITTSVTETDDSECRRPMNSKRKIHTDDIMDVLSTVDSDTLADVTDRNHYKRKPAPSYSFTPKSAVDLTLDDLVKFARPGGKMSTGRVCFVGHLPGRREVCVGLELDEDAGKHDGMFEGVRYFQCRKNRGVFISFHKIILAYKSV